MEGAKVQERPTGEERHSAASTRRRYPGRARLVDRQLASISRKNSRLRRRRPVKDTTTMACSCQGVRAFTGDDGGGATTLTVCPSARFYSKWFSGATAAEMGCVKKPRGVPVTIGSDEIVSYRFGEYFVFIKGASWSGWTGSFGIRPYIPANTKVVVHTAAPGGWTTLWPNRTSARGGIDLYSGATLLILSQDTKSENLPDLYAQITGDSPNAGKKGWITVLGLDVQGGGPLLFMPPSGVEWR